jgi:TolA-binding protein
MKLTKSKIKSFLETENSDYRNSMLNDSSLDDFDQDVLDGLTQSNILSSDFKNLDNRYYQSSISYSKWFLSISLVALISYSIYFLLSPNKDSQKTATNEVKTINQSEKLNTKKYTLKNQKIHDQENNELVKISTLENKIAVQESLDIKIGNSTNIQSKIEQTSSSMSTLNPKMINNLNSKELVGTFGIEVFILDYKILDYRHYRKSKPKTSDPFELTNGTPANASEKNNVNQENQQIEYNYFNYLKETMKLVDEKSYVMALENFNAILNSYPDDINAQFYGGFCYFEQKQYAKSIIFFNQARKSSFLNFKEEAEWLLLQSYVEISDFESAKLIRNEIISSNGFYTKRAKEMKID